MKNTFLTMMFAVFCSFIMFINCIGVNADYGHLCEGVNDEKSFDELPGATWEDSGDLHRKKGKFAQYCKVCNRQMDSVVDYKYESHYYSSYENAGHGDMSHTFVIRCGKCGHDQRIVLVCDYERTGYHVAPW